MKNLTIYKLTNKINNKSYIGLTENFEKRLKSHLNNANYRTKEHLPLYNAIRKYGWNEFEKQIVVQSIDNKDNLVAAEIFFIDLFKTRFPNGYNMTSGGDGATGNIHSIESRKRQSIKMLGRKFINRKKPPPHSQETRKKMSISRMGNKNGIKHWSDFANLNKKIIQCIETGQVFESLTACARLMNLASSNLGKHLLGKQKTFGGLTFKEVEK